MMCNCTRKTRFTLRGLPSALRRVLALNNRIVLNIEGKDSEKIKNFFANGQHVDAWELNDGTSKDDFTTKYAKQ